MPSISAYEVVQYTTISQTNRKLEVTRWGDGSIGLSITENGSNRTDSIYLTPEQTTTLKEFIND